MWPTLAALTAGAGVFASLLLIWMGLAFLVHRDAAAWLAEVTPEMPPEGWPDVAIVFAGRNEQAGVEAATRSQLAQDYPALTLIAVDDRSTDQTGAILDAIAREDPRLDVVHVHDLPAGWLGKNHALQRASERVTAPWILFTDADVSLTPTTLRRAVSFAERERLDHLAVTPDAITETTGERLFMAFFQLLFAFHSPPWKVRDRRSKASIGIGAFNLVRAEAFRAIGGLQRLSLSVEEDLRMGEALKFAGYRQALALGRQFVSVRWHTGGVWGIIRGIEKNFFAALKFRLSGAVAGTGAVLLLGLTPHAGLLVGPWWSRAICALGIASVASIFAQARRQSGVAWWHALAMPIASAACSVALLRSTWLTLWRGGVIWREHFYPLAELRTHVRRRDAWLREVWKSTR